MTHPSDQDPDSPAYDYSDDIAIAKAKAILGRPSQYRDEFCETIITEGFKGKSVAQMAIACGVSKRTLLNWAEQYPDFLHALDVAKTASLDWWETIAQTHLVESHQGEKVNASLWSRSMAARFPDDYTEKNKTELTGAGGGPIKGLNVTFVDSATK